MFGAIKPSDLPSRELPYAAPAAAGRELFTEAQAFALVAGDYTFRGCYVHPRAISFRVLAAVESGAGEAPMQMVLALRNAGVVSILRSPASGPGLTCFSLTPRGSRIAAALS